MSDEILRLIEARDRSIDELNGYKLDLRDRELDIAAATRESDRLRYEAQAASARDNIVQAELLLSRAKRALEIEIERERARHRDREPEPDR